MTTTESMPSTSLEPTHRQRWLRARPIVLIIAALVLAGVVLAWFNSFGTGGPLDPRSAGPDGARAIASLLDERGVGVERVETVDRALAEAADGTLLVTRPDLLGTERLNRLAAGGADHVILLEPDEATVWALTGDLVPAGSTVPRVREPDCSLPAANRAGTIRTDGEMYRPIESATGHAIACYGDGNRAAVLRWTGTDPDRPATVDIIGSPSVLTNERLAEQGHAALALNLLGADERLVWYVPSLRDLPAPTTPPGVVDLLPDRAVAGAMMLAIAVGLLMLAYARHLGPVVPETLPVVVRASETVEGRARLYRHSGARDRAAIGLRQATLARLRPRLGLASAAAPEVVVAAVAQRIGGPGIGGRVTGRTGAEVMDLLYGGPPRDDDQLVRLGAELDALEQEVRQS